MAKFLTAEQLRAMPDSYIAQGMATGEYAVFTDDFEKFVVARYSHSEVTTPFDRHWSEQREYFQYVFQLDRMMFQADSMPEFILQKR